MRGSPRVVIDQSYSGFFVEPRTIGATATTDVLAGMGSSFRAAIGTLRCTMEKPMTLSRPFSVTGKFTLAAVDPVMRAFTGMVTVVTARLWGSTSAETCTCLLYT